MDLTEKQILSRRASQKKYRDKNKEKYKLYSEELKDYYKTNNENPEIYPYELPLDKILVIAIGK